MGARPGTVAGIVGVQGQTKKMFKRNRVEHPKVRHEHANHIYSSVFALMLQSHRPFTLKLFTFGQPRRNSRRTSRPYVATAWSGAVCVAYLAGYMLSAITKRIAPEPYMLPHKQGSVHKNMKKS